MPINSSNVLNKSMTNLLSTDEVELSSSVDFQLDIEVRTCQSGEKFTESGQ
jgi:hypothetical protein